MKLISVIKSTDVNANAKSLDYSNFTPRNAARAVIFDGQKIALIHVSAHDYYMLPGGGLDTDDLETGLKREILEELGCDIKITSGVGKAELYFDRWKTAQTDYCFTAQKVSDVSEASITDFEKSEGHEIVWTDNIDQAIKLVEQAQPLEDDGKIVRSRDLLFLQYVKRNNFS